MQFYKVSEFARLIGVTSMTLRRWESQGILEPHHRSPSGYRYYSEDQLYDYLQDGVKRQNLVKGSDEVDDGSG